MATAPQRQMLTERVYGEIAQRLVDHAIEPGAKVNINTLAQEMDVSPTPVREALARLEADGLVVKRPHAGYTAAPLMTVKSFDDLFEMRSLLEPAAAAGAAVRIDQCDIEALTEHLAEMREAEVEASRETLRSFLRHDALFHDRIAQSSGNPLMVETLRRFRAHTHLYRLYFRDGIATQTCHEHQRILEALRDADPDAAAATMRTHIRRARERLLPAFADSHED
ncbi:GntR family transcriptional regulator [Streptomyces tubercidicus]